MDEAGSLAWLPEMLRERFGGIRYLGAGAQKQVYLAEDLASNRTVVIHRLRSEEGAAAWRDGVYQAVALQRQGRDFAIAPIDDVFESEGRVHLVGEYFPGGDLEARLTRNGSRRLPLTQVLAVGVRVAGALEFAHGSGLIHRDVKPGNLLLDASGDVYLADFGLARSVEAGAAGPLIAGTPEYLAPEQIDGEVGPASDLYSLGCLLFELATGWNPFAAGEPAECLRRQQALEPGLASDRQPGLPRVFDLLVGRLLQKDPARRPSRASDVRVSLEGLREQLEDTGVPGHASERHSRLVGRRDEVADMDALLGGCVEGDSRVLLLEGRAGEGKSRLIDELVARAHRLGVIPLVGRGSESFSKPMGAMIAALRPLAFRSDELPPEDAVMIRGILGAASPFGQSGAREGKPEDDRGREEMPRSLWTALRAWSSETPMVLVLDDLHWADSSTQRLVGALARALARGFANLHGVGLAAAFRPVSAESLVGEIVGDLESEPLCETRTLAPLDPANIHELLTARGVTRPSEQLVRTIHQVTGGNVLFAGLILDHLERVGAVQIVHGFSVLSGRPEDLGLAGTISEAIEERLCDLDATARDCLARLACVGMRFTPSVLEEVTGRPNDQARSELREAVRLEVLIAEDGGWRFAHPLIRSVLYDGLAAFEREVLHHRLARRHLRWAAEGSIDDVFSAAHHLLRSGRQVEVGEVAKWTRKAGQLALDRCAWSEAAGMFEATLEVAAAAGGLSDLEVAELHRRAGESHFYAFDTAPCLEHLELAIDGFRKEVDSAGLARSLNDQMRALGQFGRLPYGSLGDVEPLFEALQALGGEEPRLRARILGTLAEVHWFAQRNDSARSLADSAVDLASQCGDDWLCGETLIQQSLAQTQELRFGEAIASLSSARVHAERAQDRLMVDQAMQRIGFNLYMTGKVAEAEAIAAEAEERSELIQSPGETAFTQSLLVSISALREHSADAERRASIALELGRRAHFPWSSAVLLPAVAYSRMLREDWSGARDAVSSLSRPGVVFDDPSIILSTVRMQLALLDAYSGDPVALEPGELGEGALPPGDEAFDFSLLTNVCLHVELCELAGRPIDERAVRALEFADRRGVCLSLGWPFVIPRVLGICLLAHGELDHAEAALERALTLSREIGSRFEEARLRFELARAHATRSSHFGFVGARRQLDLALPVLENVGPAHLHERATRLARYVEDRMG